jgi:pilus assembly protein CpaC
MMNMTFSSHTKRPVASKLARLLLSAAMAMTCFTPAFPLLTQPASATDIEASSTEQQSEGTRLVRLGLNKSAVIRLPGQAHDVVVGNDQIVDAVLRKKDTIYLFARETGQTNIFVFDADGQQILAIDFEVALDTLPLKKLLQRQLPGNRIKIDTVNSNVVLSGTARSAEEAKLAHDLAKQFMTAGSGGGQASLINAMTIAGENQVMLKVKIVEIERKVLKQLGINLQAILQSGENVINLASINPFVNSLVSAGGISASDNVGNTRYDSALRAMETDGLSRTLAEPNLTTISGQSANFLAGGELPFKVCDSGGSCGVEFKPYGIRLNFTPTVMTNERINLKIETEVSEIGALYDGIPSINTRRAQTVIETSPGGSMMLAGLIREVTKQDVAGTPGLKKLPVLGSLFRSREFLQNETELVVLVTPYLVKPVREQDLVAPDKNYHPTDDKEAIFFGRLNKQYNSSGKNPDGAYTGSVGYIVE